MGGTHPQAPAALQQHALREHKHRVKPSAQAPIKKAAHKGACPQAHSGAD